MNPLQHRFEGGRNANIQPIALESYSNQGIYSAKFPWCRFKVSYFLKTHFEIRKSKYLDYSFDSSIDREEYQGLLTYYVPPSQKIKWSAMFGLMETAKSTLHIEDYSISQTSLEQVFLSFTKFQREEAQNNRSASRQLKH